MCILAEAGGASYGGNAEGIEISGQPTAKIMGESRLIDCQCWADFLSWTQVLVYSRCRWFFRTVHGFECAYHQGQTNRDAQAHLAKEFYDVATEWAP